MIEIVILYGIEDESLDFKNKITFCIMFTYRYLSLPPSLSNHLTAVVHKSKTLSIRNAERTENWQEMTFLC